MRKSVSFITIIPFISLLFIFSIADIHADSTTNERKTISFSNNESTRKSISTTKRNSFLIEVSVESLIFAEIAKLEMKEEPYKFCRLITNPPTLANFGLTAEIRPEVVDLTKAEYLSKAAQSNSYIANIAELDKLKLYSYCIVQYAELISKVLQNIKDSYNSVADLQRHISNLVKQYADEKSNLVNMINNINFKNCRFADSSVNKIQCNELFLEIANTPRLILNKKKIFTDSVYLGISAKFSIEKSSAAEFAKAVEQATQTLRDMTIPYTKY